ncbi:hypothetical protein D3C87_1680660 [compost metagenome]
MVNGTKAGAVGTIASSNFFAVRIAKSDAPNLATGKPPLAITTFLAFINCSPPSVSIVNRKPSASFSIDLTTVFNLRS